MSQPPSPTYHLSPFCVFHAAHDGPDLLLHHALHGTRFRVSAELLDAMGSLLRGTTLGDLARDGGVALRDALASLIQEEIILDQASLEELGGSELFRNRLGPIPLSVQRSFTEGGLIGDGASTGPPPPLRKSDEGQEAIKLASGHTDPVPESFLTVLRRRRSLRHFSAEPLPLGALERFLDLTVRMQSVQAVGPDEVGFRAFPSGGGRQPLEIYVFVRDVESLEPGLYRYDALEHRLLRLRDRPEGREALFQVAGRNLGPAAARAGDPSVLFAVTAVVARTCWKYEGIEYQLILQEVGALYQTFYLVATMMGLAPCAVGAFPELAVAELLGVDPLDEIQVGLFALGVAADH